jgi:exodeoxyribonuclease VII small subunit
MTTKTASFEKNIERLQQIVDQLETGGLALEKGVSLYKEGLSLAGACRKQLDEARLVVNQVSPEGIAPFDASGAEEN